MIGNNSLHLNEATLIEAMQEYLLKRMGATHVPKVTAVRLDGVSSSCAQTFIVSVTHPATPAAAEAK